MADEKIRITWDEVQSPEVDVRIKQQQMLTRAQEHYQQQVAQPAPAIAPAAALPRKTSILHNTLFYMTVFGLFGGLSAWLCGEIVQLSIPNRFEEYSQAFMEVKDVLDKVKRGEITEDQGTAAIKNIESRYSNNPYVKIVIDQSLLDTEKESRIEKQLSNDYWRSILSWLVFYCSVGILLAFFLAIADQVISRNWRGVIINGSVGIVLGAIGGTVVALFIDKLYQAIGGGNVENLGKQMLARTIAWATIGLFLCLAQVLYSKTGSG